jgi:hypothetical protein
MSRYDAEYIALSQAALAQDAGARAAVADVLLGLSAVRRAQAAESFERCDTDGFLSQWASGLSAQRAALQAEIVRSGGRAQFRGLYLGDERIPAVPAQRMWEGQTSYHWRLAPEAEARFGRRYIPRATSRGPGRIMKALGLSERAEMAPAYAAVRGSGTGLSGCASAYVGAERMGDPWGMDAVLASEKVEG